MTVRHRQNCQKYRIMHNPWIRITNPGTRSCKSASNINMVLRCLSLFYRWKIPSGAKARACIQVKALNYAVINNILFRIDTHKNKDRDKKNSFLLVIPEKYKLIIFHTYHDSLLASDEGPYRTAMTVRQKFFIHN